MENFNLPWLAAEKLHPKITGQIDQVKEIEIRDSQGTLRATVSLLPWVSLSNLHEPSGRITDMAAYRRALKQATETADVIVTCVNSGLQVMEDLAPLLAPPH